MLCVFCVCSLNASYQVYLYLLTFVLLYLFSFFESLRED